MQYYVCDRKFYLSVFTKMSTFLHRPEMAYMPRDMISLPALKQTMGNKAVERRKRTQILQKARLRREVLQWCVTNPPTWVQSRVVVHWPCFRLWRLSAVMNLGFRVISLYSSILHIQTMSLYNFSDIWLVLLVLRDARLVGGTCLILKVIWCNIVVFRPVWRWVCRFSS